MRRRSQRGEAAELHLDARSWQELPDLRVPTPELVEQERRSGDAALMGILLGPSAGGFAWDAAGEQFFYAIDNNRRLPVGRTCEEIARRLRGAGPRYLDRLEASIDQSFHSQLDAAFRGSRQTDPRAGSGAGGGGGEDDPAVGPDARVHRRTQLPARAGGRRRILQPCGPRGTQRLRRRCASTTSARSARPPPVGRSPSRPFVPSSRRCSICSSNTSAQCRPTARASATARSCACSSAWPSTTRQTEASWKRRFGSAFTPTTYAAPRR